MKSRLQILGAVLVAGILLSTTARASRSRAFQPTATQPWPSTRGRAAPGNVLGEEETGGGGGGSEQPSGEAPG